MKKYVPRWLYSRKLTVPGTDYVEVDSTIFRNDTIWPMKLEWMSVISTGANMPQWGGAAHRMAIEMSISGKGPMFPTPESMSALFTPMQCPRLKLNYSMAPGLNFDFNQNVVIPPNTGIVAEMFNRNTTPTIIPPPAKINGIVEPIPGGWFNPSIVFKGIIDDPHSEGKDPVMLADRWPFYVGPEDSKVLRGAGLRNNGLKNVRLKHMSLSSGSSWGHDTEPPMDALAYSLLEWRVNPTTGVQWMPDPSTIPVGAIAPYNRCFFDMQNIGPRVMEFADNIYMNPTQQLELGIYSDYEEDVSLGLCLFGYMEVE